MQNVIITELNLHIYPGYQDFQHSQLDENETCLYEYLTARSHLVPY